VNTSPTRDSYTISSSSSPTRRPGPSAPARKTPYRPRSGMVPPEVTANRCAPRRPLKVSVTRSQVRRGRSSANSSDGYRPLSMSRTDSSIVRVSPPNGAARRASVSRSSTVHSSRAIMATTCWARTSSGLAGTRNASIAPARIRSAITAVCTRSPRNFGNRTPRDTAPTWWPARPTRCRPEATDGGASTWMTRSTAPMSMPNSRLDVATTAGSRPALRSSSVWSLCSRLTDPWCARARTAGAPRLIADCAITWAGARAGGTVKPGAAKAGFGADAELPSPRAGIAASWPPGAVFGTGDA